MAPLRRSLLLPVLVAVALAGPAPAPAQPPDDEWRTLELPHFRVHYPAASEEWARRAAARLEAVRERLIEEVGYAPPQVVDVIVADPLSRPNGSAWPLLGNPRMVLWTTPPAPSSILGSYRDWGELVALHEDVHLVHLLRPSRNRLRDRLGRLLPAADLGPIAHRAPRWVTEGYATLLEGRLTGAGRPHGGLRAAVLRQRARAGRLPGYGALGAGDDSWLGDSMAYLAGSAYLEWLEERAGPSALRDLWARMTARRDRSFDEAFRGVFGDGPAELYGRFTAELTWRAMEAERRLGGEEAEGSQARGELWADLSRGTGAPAVSPDGLRIAAVLAGEPGDGAPPRLVVWETAVDEEAEERWREERERTAREDPEDVPAVRSAPPARKVVATLPTFDGRAPADPRWIEHEGDASLIFWALGPGPDGVDRADLYRWRPDGDRGVERLTRGADLRYPEPLARERALAVRSRHGQSQLVAVDLATGAVTALTEASAAEVWATPRVAPPAGVGAPPRLAAMVHRDGRWRLVVAELTDGGPPFGPALGARTEIETPDGATVADPAWGPDHTLYAATGSDGFVDLRAWRLGAGTEAGSPLTLTRTLGAALAPAPAPDGLGVYYLSLEHDGLDLRRLELPAPSERTGEAGLDDDELALLVPAVAPPPGADVPDFAAADLPDGRPYGVGPLTATPVVGLAATSGAQALEAGVAVNDPVGRLDALLLGSLGRAGALEGATLAAAWRGWPVEVSGQLFAVREEPSGHDGPSVADRQGGSASILDRDRFGLWAAGIWRRAFPAGGVAARLGLHGERVEPEAGIGGPDHTVDQRAATLSGAVGWTPSRGRWRLPLELAAGLQEGESELGGDSWSWHRGALRASAGIGRGSDSLTLGWSRHGSDGLRLGFERFQVGGLARSLLPVDVDFARIEAPALPAGTLVGDEHESQRVELRLDALPVPLFWERHRVWDGGRSDAAWLSLAGFELAGALPPMPILGLPAARWTAGAAWVLEDPIEDDPRVADPEGASLENEIRLWGGLVWRP